MIEREKTKTEIQQSIPTQFHLFSRTHPHRTQDLVKLHLATTARLPPDQKKTKEAKKKERKKKKPRNRIPGCHVFDSNAEKHGCPVEPPLPSPEIWHRSACPRSAACMARMTHIPLSLNPRSAFCAAPQAPHFSLKWRSSNNIQLR